MTSTPSELARPSGGRSRAALLLVLPFLALPALTGSTLLPRHRRPTAPMLVEPLLLDHQGAARVVLLGATAPVAQVRDLEGHALGRLGPAEVTHQQALWLRAGRLLLFLGDDPDAKIEQAHLGLLPLEGGDSWSRRYRLPAPALLRFDLRGPILTAEPLALRCGDEVLLRTRRGWARLAVAPGVKRRRQRTVFGAPLLEGAAPSGCEALTPVRRLPPLVTDRAALAEVERGGERLTLGSLRSPPIVLTLATADRQVDRRLAPPLEVLPRGPALVGAGRVLLQGRSCEAGEWLLALAELHDPLRRPFRWARGVPAACERDGSSRGDADAIPAAWACERAGLLQLEAPGEGLRTSLAFGLASGEDAAPLPAAALKACVRLAPLGRAEAWRTGREFALHRGASAGREQGEFALHRGASAQPPGGQRRSDPSRGEADRLRVLEGPPRVIAWRGGPALPGSPLWSARLASPALILGVTDRAVVLVGAPDQLLLLDRASGRELARRRLPLLQDEDGEPASLRWVGHRGEAGAFVIDWHVGSSWLVTVAGTTVRVAP